MDEEARRRIAFADQFAERAHEGQVRKGGDTPYITHPRAVSALLRDFYPGSERLTIAGLLHDVIEDTPIRIETIDALFGREVGDLVWGVTNTRPNWQLTTRMEPDIHRLKGADLISNIGDTQRDIESGHFVWPRFNRGRAKVAFWERQVRIIEEVLTATPAADGRRKGDTGLLLALRGRIDVMKGMVNIVTDAETAIIAQREEVKHPVHPAPRHLKGDGDWEGYKDAFPAGANITES